MVARRIGRREMVTRIVQCPWSVVCGPSWPYLCSLCCLLLRHLDFHRMIQPERKNGPSIINIGSARYLNAATRGPGRVAFALEVITLCRHCMPVQHYLGQSKCQRAAGRTDGKLRRFHHPNERRSRGDDDFAADYNIVRQHALNFSPRRITGENVVFGFKQNGCTSGNGRGRGQLRNKCGNDENQEYFRYVHKRWLMVRVEK